MAVDSVNFLLLTVRNEVDLFFRQIKGVEDVEANLSLCSGLLEDLDMINNKGQVKIMVERDIRNLICRLENAIDVFNCTKQNVYGFIDKLAARRKFWKEMEEINDTLNRTFEAVDEILSSSALENQGLSRQESKRIPHFIVGLEEVTEKLKFQLFRVQHQVVCIYGISGAGKTTLAMQLYQHGDVRVHFESFAWIDKFTKKNVFANILNQLCPEISKNELIKEPQEVLAKQLLEVQQQKNCLIVLDDIWSMDALVFLQKVFPSGKTHSKILVTTREREVAVFVAGDGNGIIHTMRRLTESESSELFRKMAFPEDHTEVHSIKNDIEEELLSQCDGIPSVIIEVGKLLSTKRTLREWEMVLHNIRSFMSRGVRIEQIRFAEPVPSLSFDVLPYRLKPCFLYLGLFPEGMKVEVEHLYLLWIAEGMISADDCQNNETIMDVAERYLSELVKRNMVEVEEEKTSGFRKYMSCRIHELMRGYCLQKGEEYFLKGLDIALVSQIEADSSSFPWRKKSAGRLALHFGQQVDRCAVGSPEKFSKHTRSLLLLNPHDLEIKFIWPGGLSKLKRSMMLRILYFESFDFRHGNLPRGVTKLVHLRYLSFKGCILGKLPSSMGNLSFLCILDLRIKSSCRIIIPNVLWKLKKLRHLYLPALFQTEATGDKLHLGKLKELQILVNFDTGLCNVADLFEMEDLLYLSVTVGGKVEELEQIVHRLNMTSNRLLHSSVKVKTFDCYTEEMHSVFRKLLECQILHTLNMEGHLGYIPFYHKITSSLTEIVLKGSHLKEDPMKILEKLSTLQLLILQDDAFLGKEMKCSAFGFPNLKHLELLSLSFLETWEVDGKSMLELSILSVKNCKKLQMLPHALQSRRLSLTFENDN